jgi:hypothetical protein
VEAVHVKVVPELVVEEAASAVGRLGTAVHPPPPPLLEPPPQAGRRIRLADIIQNRESPRDLLRCGPFEPNPTPIKAMPGTTIHAA